MHEQACRVVDAPVVCEPLRLPGMLLVAGATSDAGKTTFACRVVARFSAQSSLVAAKVTTISQSRGPCPRGKGGCGACTSLTQPYDMTDERPSAGPPKKDTGRLLAAGAGRAIWMRALRTSLPEAAQALAHAVGPRASVCESSSLRLAVQPDLFLMVGTEGRPLKPSAAEVRGMVDRFVEPHAVERTLAELDLWRGRWRIREPATLVVLSEERSPRWSGVGLDPQGLEGMAGLGSRFEQVIVSASVPEHVDAAGCSVAPPWSYTGPLAAMAAGLEASRNDLALVVPGSLATLDGELVERLLWATEGCDAAVLLAGGQAEPALIACRRGLVPLARAALSQGQRWIGAFLAKCRTKAVDKAFHEPGHRLQEGRAPMDSTDGGAGAQEGGGGL